jgi:hypothetical protein
MKKILALVMAAILSCSAFVLPVNAAEEEITDHETIQKIVYVLKAEHFADLHINCSLYNGNICIGYDDVSQEAVFGDLVKYLSEYNINTSQISFVSNAMATIQPFPSRAVYTLGDLTENGTVQLNDVLKALKAYTVTAGQAESGLSETQSYAADVDGSGDLTLSDAQNILRYYTVNTLGQQNVSWVDIVVFGV